MPLQLHGSKAKQSTGPVDNGDEVVATSVNAASIKEWSSLDRICLPRKAGKPLQSVSGVALTDV